MKICPKCREEFLDHVENCTACKVDLVTSLEARVLAENADLLSKEEILQGETAIILEGPLAQCRELERLLSQVQVSSVVYPVSLDGDNDQTAIGSTKDRKYMLLLRLLDVDRAKKALEGRFIDQVVQEGQGHFVSTAVDLSHDVITCPACGEANPLKNGECPACGLFLDVIDSEPQKTK